MGMLKKSLCYTFAISKAHNLTHYKQLVYGHGADKNEAVGEAKHKLIKWLLAQTNNKNIEAQLAQLLSEQSALQEELQVEELLSKLLCYMAKHGHEEECSLLLAEGVNATSQDSVSSLMPQPTPPIAHPTASAASRALSAASHAMAISRACFSRSASKVLSTR